MKSETKYDANDTRDDKAVARFAIYISIVRKNIYGAWSAANSVDSI